MGILFTEKEWDEFREECNKIIMNGNPKNWVGIFDDYETIMTNCLTWIKPGGRILIFNMFNPFDLDVTL